MVGGQLVLGDVQDQADTSQGNSQDVYQTHVHADTYVTSSPQTAPTGSVEALTTAAGAFALHQVQPENGRPPALGPESIVDSLIIVGTEELDMANYMGMDTAMHHSAPMQATLPALTPTSEQQPTSAAVAIQHYKATDDAVITAEPTGARSDAPGKAAAGGLDAAPERLEHADMETHIMDAAANLQDDIAMVNVNNMPHAELETNAVTGMGMGMADAAPLAEHTARDHSSPAGYMLADGGNDADSLDGNTMPHASIVDGSEEDMLAALAQAADLELGDIDYPQEHDEGTQHASALHSHHVQGMHGADVSQQPNQHPQGSQAGPYHQPHAAASQQGNRLSQQQLRLSQQQLRQSLQQGEDQQDRSLMGEGSILANRFLEKCRSMGEYF